MHHFRTNYPSGPVLPTGDLLNAITGELNALAGVGRTPPPGVLIGQARITDASDSGGIIAGSGGERDAPNADNNKYLCEFRFFNSGTQKWEAHNLGYQRLDAGAYHGGTHGSGPIPKYAVGDVVPVWFDAQRNWLVPLHSPPEQISSITFRAQESVRLSKLTTGPYIDAASICLELRRAQEWHRFLPELSLGPRGFTSGAFGQVTVIVALRHRDELRMTGGTAKHSTAELSVYEHGFHIVPLARLAPQVPGQPAQDQPGTGEMTEAYDNFTVLPNLQSVTTTPSRFRDHPRFTYVPKDKSVRVDMADPFAQWMCAVTYWAEVFQPEPSGVFVQIAHTTDANELYPTGWLREPIDVDGEWMHPAVLDFRDAAGKNHQAGDRQRCYLKFTDYGGANGGNVVAEQGRIFGPCEFVGVTEADDESEGGESDGEDSENSSGAPRSERPVFRVAAPELEFLAKLDGPTVAKGGTGTFELFDRGGPTERASGITVEAKALVAEIELTTPPQKWCLVKRLNGTWYASQWEC